MRDNAGRYMPPEPWRRPVQETQLSLFPYSLDEYLAMAHVSRDDLRRWRERGWISFDADSLSELHQTAAHEIIFVRNLAQSGLSDAQVVQFLSEVPKPYTYDPVLTAYHFAHGWVQAPPPLDEDDEDRILALIDEHLSEWLKAKAEEGDVSRLADVTMQAFGLIRDRRKKSPEESP